MRRAAIAILALSLGISLWSGAAMAVQPDEVLGDPALEGRARELSRELRCMVCQNQSIDDSDAPLARDLRLLVRERLVAGDKDSEVIEFLVARYGEFVLLRPRLSLHTLILWLAPPAAVLAGALAIVVALRRRARTTRAGATAAKPLTPEEEKRLRSLLQNDATLRRL